MQAKLFTLLFTFALFLQSSITIEAGDTDSQSHDSNNIPGPSAISATPLSAKLQELLENVNCDHKKEDNLVGINLVIQACNTDFSIFCGTIHSTEEDAVGIVYHYHCPASNALHSPESDSSHATDKTPLGSDATSAVAPKDLLGKVVCKKSQEENSAVIKEFIKVCKDNTSADCKLPSQNEELTAESVYLYHCPASAIPVVLVAAPGVAAATTAAATSKATTKGLWNRLKRMTQSGCKFAASAKPGFKFFTSMTGGNSKLAGPGGKAKLVKDQLCNPGSTSPGAPAANAE